MARTALRSARLKCKKEKGFTLIEVVVVVALISIILFLVLPRLQNTLLLDDTQKTARWIISAVKRLREDAVTRQKGSQLVVDLTTNRLWVAQASEADPQPEPDLQASFSPPANVRISDVEFPFSGKISAGRAEIDFYAQGYSDKAAIHLSGGRQDRITLVIEPFLEKVAVFERYVGFEED